MIYMPSKSVAINWGITTKEFQRMHVSFWVDRVLHGLKAVWWVNADKTGEVTAYHYQPLVIQKALGDMEQF